MADTNNVLSELKCATGYYAYGGLTANYICVALPTGYLTYTITSGILTALTCSSGYYLVRTSGANAGTV
jgi:hypothetical protein